MSWLKSDIQWTLQATHVRLGERSEWCAIVETDIFRRIICLSCLGPDLRCPKCYAQNILSHILAPKKKCPNFNCDYSLPET